MLKKAVYVDKDIKVKVEVESIDVLIKSEEYIINFPRIVQLEGEKLVLAYGPGMHGSKVKGTTNAAALSDDFGKTWTPVSGDSPWMDNVQSSGILGYMKDGTIAYIDVTSIEGRAKKYKSEEGVVLHNVNWHIFHRVEDPTFRLRWFSKRGELSDVTYFKIKGLPFKVASYEFYGTLLELGDGSLLTGFNYCTAVPEETGSYEGGVAVCRSTDGGQSFEFLSTCGKGGSDMELLANGDILNIMRGPDKNHMSYWSKSRDNGRTWSEPVPTGWPGVEPKMILLSNGVLVCSTGRGVYGHPQITHAMFSLDGTGEKWEYPFAFHTGPGCSYTDLFERDGKLYVVYSHSDFTKPFGTNNLEYQSIKWAVINVSKE